ncbi:MAG: dihydroorotase [Deltaproteobacteria bacterium]|jgi:dihydroorotase|nr:dihydroorotase [Deltaproteobacteria bacterium]
MLLIKNGRVIDPSGDIDDHLDILVDQGKIVKLRRGVDKKEKESEVVQIIDAQGKVVVPGLIDMHVHLREPGYEYKETIKTGCQAAASGGFTSIACMPNTSPINDNQAVTEYILDKAKREGCVNVFPVGAITKGLEGEFLAEMGELRNAGVVAVSDDGKSVINGELMRRGMEYARNFNLLVICHCENPDLVAGGVMNEGFTSTRLGLKGIPNAAEETIVARDIILAEMTGCRVHIAHVSTEGAVRIIREAKSRGVNVTAETAPHYFSLSEEALESFDTNLKVNPPLRSAIDVEAVKEGLKDGTLDVIATDHAPHSSLEKDVEFDYASSGLVGLETALPLALQLVKEKVLSLSELITKFTANPAKILNMSKGRLNPGNDADITIIDVSLKNRVDVNQFKSRSRNSPFHGWELEGGAVFTIVKGKVIKDANGLVV